VHTALSFDLVGEDVLVSGAGPIGMMAAAVAKHVGARNVVITDVNEYRLELARKMGVTRAVNVAKENLNDVMAELGMTEGSTWVWRCPARRRRSAPCSIP
jgi:threonine 3-dehydrogenase